MTETALEAEVTPEVTETPTATQEPGTKTVPAERFNGLQRAHQEALAKLRQYEQASTPATPETPATPTPQPEEENPLTEFLQELMQERVENWRDAAIAQYPSVAPIREYLTANSRAEVLALAKDLSEKLGGTTPSSEEETPMTSTPASPPAPPSSEGQAPSVTGGAPAVSPSGDENQSELDELRARAKQTKSSSDWAAYWSKQRELAGWPF